MTNTSTTTGQLEALDTGLMTSWEMSKEVNKPHANVLRDIRRRLQSRGIDHEPYRVQLPDHRGYRRWVYALPRGLATELMACYSTTIRREQGTSTDALEDINIGWIPETRLSSREIAASFEIPHNRVLRDIRRVLKRCGEDESRYRDDRPDGKGILRPVVALPRKLLLKLPYSYDGVLHHWYDLNTAMLAERKRIKEQHGQAMREANQEGRKWFNLSHRRHPVTEIQDKNGYYDY
jgi:hypothetical protein